MARPGGEGQRQRVPGAEQFHAPKTTLREGVRRVAEKAFVVYNSLSPFSTRTGRGNTGGQQEGRPVAGRDYGVPTQAEIQSSLEQQRREDPVRFEQTQQKLGDFLTRAYRQLNDELMKEDARRVGP
jgi:hypothetical protein